MAIQQLVDYIKKAKQVGQTDEKIKTFLVTGGWTEAEMAEAFAVVNPPSASTSPNIQQPKAKPALPQINNFKTPKEHRSIIRPLIGFLVIMLFFAGAYIVAGQYINLPFNLFGPSPEQVIMKAWENLKNVKSQTFSTEFSASSKDLQTGTKTGGVKASFDIKVKASGGFDSVNKLGDVQASLSALATDQDSNKFEISLAGDAKLIQKDLYLQLKEINLGQFAMFLALFGAPDPSEFKGQWIRVPLDEASQQDLSQQFQTISGQQTAVDKDLQDAITKITKIILVDKKVYDIKKLADNKSAEGQEYHYFVSLNQKKFLDAAPDIFKVLQDLYAKTNPGQTPPADMTLVEFQKGINDFFNKFGIFSTDLYIGKSDNFFHKFQFKKDLDMSKIGNAGDYTGIVTISYTMEQGAINKEIKVTPPENSKTFEELFAPYIKNSQIEQNFSQIYGLGVSIFSKSKSYSTLCSNTSIANVLKDIKNLGIKNVLCLASTTNYCISAQLDNGSYKCMGSGTSGIPGTTKCISAKTMCK